MKHYYKVTDIIKFLDYKSPRTFLFAANKATKENKNDLLIVKIWKARVPSKIGRQIVWLKESVDNILEGKK